MTGRLGVSLQRDGGRGGSGGGEGLRLGERGNNKSAGDGGVVTVVVMKET